MNVTSLPVRRSLTAIGATAALILGFGAIQASAAWTASAAPLSVAPTSVKSIESKLADEQARSTELQAQLKELASSSSELIVALEAAQAQIDTDTTHAQDLEKDLKAAKKKLAALERSIRQSAQAASARTTTRTTTTKAAAPRQAEGETGTDD